MPIEFELVYAVYLRKQGDNSTEDDDAYQAERCEGCFVRSSFALEENVHLAPQK